MKEDSSERKPGVDKETSGYCDVPERYELIGGVRVHLTIDQFVLDGGRYQLEATHIDIGELTTSRFPCIRIDLERLFGSIARFRQDK
ncbi:hypothetical protein [Paenibacillus koleovorans]|uniref:hypothetical protein n=1 Tax=Paenibacillus koleovorans TaxID=121608 RepID=UPI000FD75C1F|nr:hypothetical protein [Paenibacillus koleovorans]